MRFEDVSDALKDATMTRPKKGRVLYDAVLEKRPNRILELGFHQGISTGYLAAALDELGRGSIVTIDRAGAIDRHPNIHEHLDRLGLASYVTPVFAHRSFTWELAKMIRDGDQEPFDFVFHDGGHNWDTAGYAFFLTDKLCAPGTWMLFDDLPWTHESKSVAESGWVKEMSDDERTTPHVDMVFELLVKQHPGYDNFSTTYNGWMGWAQKAQGGVASANSTTQDLPHATRSAAMRTKRAATKFWARGRRKLRNITDRS